MQPRTAILKNNDAVAYEMSGQLMERGFLRLRLAPQAENMATPMLRQALRRIVPSTLRIAAMVGELEDEPLDQSKGMDCAEELKWGPQESILLIKPAEDRLALDQGEELHRRVLIMTVPQRQPMASANPELIKAFQVTVLVDSGHPLAHATSPGPINAGAVDVYVIPATRVAEAPIQSQLLRPDAAASRAYRPFFARFCSPRQIES